MAVQTKIFRSTLQVEYFTGVIWSGMVIVSGGILFIWNGFVAVVLRPLLSTGSECFKIIENDVRMFYRGLNKEPHFLCLFFTVVWLALLISSLAAKDFVVHFFSFLFYCAYLVECWWSRTFAFVQNKANIVQLENYVHKVKLASPSLRCVAKCYHMETRTHSTYHAHTKTTTHTTYLVEVVTHIAYKSFPYKYCVDVTSNLPFIGPDDVKKVYCYKSHVFADDYTSNAFSEFERKFRNEHANCDSKRLFWTELSIGGFKESILACADLEKTPYCIKFSCAYILMSIFGMSWVYRVCLSGYCGEARIVFRKKIGMRQF